MRPKFDATAALYDAVALMVCPLIVTVTDGAPVRLAPLRPACARKSFFALRLAGGDGLRVGVGIGGADVDDRRLRRLDRGEQERDHRKSHDDRHRAVSIGEGQLLR